jgi:pentatricopeptide repeat protein
MTQKAEALMEKLKSTGLLTLPFSYNQMMLLYKRKGMENKVLEVLEDMKAAGVPKDVYTYNILMDVKARSGDIEGMEKIFEELNADENVKADAATFGTLATSCIHAGLLDKAKGYLKEMEQGDVFRNRSAYDILLSQYGAVGDVEGVERVWEKVKSGPVVSNRSYITVIEAFGKLGMVEKAEELYEIMSKSKGLILSRQFNALLSAYARKGLMDKAEKVVEDMEKLGRKKNATT